MARTMLLAGAALALLSGAATAQSPRVVTERPGPDDVVRVIGERGKTLLLVFPQGAHVETVFVGEQDIIDNVTPPVEMGPGGRPAAQQPIVAQTQSPDQKQRCTTRANLMTCIQGSRHVSVMPITDLAPQPMQVLAMYERRNGTPEEKTYIFELRTVGWTPPPSAQVRADGPMEPLVGMYRVTIEHPAPPPAPPRPAGQAVVRAPRRSSPQYTVPRVEIPPPLVLNQQYVVQGDRALVGEAR